MNLGNEKHTWKSTAITQYGKEDNSLSAREHFLSTLNMPRKEDIRKFTNLPFQGVKNSGNQLNISLSGLQLENDIR